MQELKTDVEQLKERMDDTRAGLIELLLEIKRKSTFGIQLQGLVTLMSVFASST